MLAKHEFNYNVNGNNIWKVIFDFYVNYIVFIQVYIVIFMHDKIQIYINNNTVNINGKLIQMQRLSFSHSFYTTTNI